MIISDKNLKINKENFPEYCFDLRNKISSEIFNLCSSENTKISDSFEDEFRECYIEDIWGSVCTGLALAMAQLCTREDICADDSLNFIIRKAKEYFKELNKEDKSNNK